MSILSYTLITVLAVAPAHTAGRAAPPPDAAPVRVVATLPVYASIVKALGGNEVTVTSIADPREDAHFVRPKPSFALEIRRAVFANWRRNRCDYAGQFLLRHLKFPFALQPSISRSR